MTTTARERHPEIAPGVYRLGTRWVNFYLVAALASLDRLDAIDAELVAPAHGEPWTGGSARAIEIARENF